MFYEKWTVDDGTVKGPREDMYPLLFERIHATDADLVLAAAAPRLLEALRGLMDYVGGWDSPADHPCGIARDALASVLPEYRNTNPNGDKRHD